jgi:UDP-glucuronate 4-epimerase
MPKKIWRQEILFASSSSVYGKNEKVPFQSDPVDRRISICRTKKAGDHVAHTISPVRFITVACAFSPFTGRDKADLRYQITKLITEGSPFFLWRRIFKSNYSL